MLDQPVFIFGTPTTYLELFAVCCGLASVWFMKKENILVYPFGIINVLIYCYICFISGLYAYAGINIFYGLMSVYGWFSWVRRSESDERIRITRLTVKGLAFYGMMIALFIVVLWVVLNRYTDSEIPFWDALTSGIYLIAMWLLARKKIEHWILWIVGDIISIGMFIWLNLFFSAFQFLVFTIIAVFGFIEWKHKIGYGNR